jgi:hypothetical protein
MEGFKKIVLICAIIILIIVLILIGISLHYAKDETWPPMVASCPDYWLLNGNDSSGNTGVCTDIKDLADWSKCPPESGKKHTQQSFDNAAFTGTNGTCAKYNWATNCGVSWDGITYGLSTNPCQESG